MSSPSVKPSGCDDHLMDEEKRAQAGGIQLLLTTDAAAPGGLAGDGLDLHRRGQVGEVLRCPGRADHALTASEPIAGSITVPEDEEFAVQAGPVLRRQPPGRPRLSIRCQAVRRRASAAAGPCWTGAAG